MESRQSEKIGLFRPENATTFLRQFLLGEVRLDQVGEVDPATVKGRTLQWAPGAGPRPEVLPKRRGRLPTLQTTKNFLCVVESFKKASAKFKKREAAVAEVMQETGFSRKTVYAALKIWKRIRWEDDPEFDAALKRIKREWEDGPELG
jgi:hypothetical protein